MTVAPISLLERKAFIIAPSGAALVLLIAVLSAFAAYSGERRMSETAAAQSAFHQTALERMDEWRGELAEIEETGEASSPYVARPMNIRMPAVLPGAPLGDFAVGATDLYPTSTTITGWSSTADLFTKYEFSNPTMPGYGRFDLTFLAVVIMPLLMIAASFDALSADRESGRARLMAAQTAQLSHTVWTRLAIRCGLIWLVFALAAAAAALMNGTLSGARLLAFGAWLGIALVYGAFWFSLIALGVAWFKRSETVAATLFSLWAVFVFAIPAIGGALTEAIYPSPSRLALLSEMRAAEGEANREADRLTAGFLMDHPELTVSDEDVPGYFRSTFLANMEAEKRTAPILIAFEEASAKRRELTSVLQYASPAMIAQEALTAIAGGDSARNLRFQKQAREALENLSDKVGPAVIAKQRISLAAYDAIAPFTFRDLSLSKKLSTLAASALFLILLTILCLFVARRRLAGPLEKLL